MLTPNEVYTMHGVTVREKIIPDGTRWQNDEKAKRAGFASGQFFKAHYLLCKTGRADYITMAKSGVRPISSQATIVMSQKVIGLHLRT